MKHGMFQRSVSLLLALVMILGNVPMNALAAEGEETTAPACEHSYDAVTTDATCSQDGSVVYTCACGDTYTETIPATGEHAWGDWTVTAEATYEAAGLETRACGCGATEEREIPQLVAAHEHAWGDWTVAAEATYEAAGLETRTCECGETENREIPQLVKVKAELSGNTRKLYFLNTEAWEEVHVFWSFEEEDFEDVAFPSVKMEADEDLENVFVVELPVEADAVTFNDGVEVTEELKTYERENGIEAIHFFAAELSAELDYFSAAEQVEDENNATEWLSYEDVLEAWEAEIAAVQALIDALPTVFASEAEVDAFWTSTEALDAAIEALTEAQQDKLDQSNYDAAMDAAAAFANPEFDDAGTWAASNPTWDANATNPYIIHVAYGEADDITQGQLWDLLNALANKNSWTVVNGSTGLKGGYKYGEKQLTSIANTTNRNGDAGLSKDTVYTIQYCSKMDGFLWYKETWTTAGSFTVHEAEEAQTVTVDNNSFSVDYIESKGAAAQWSMLREEILKKVGTVKVNGTAVTDNISVQFHYKALGRDEYAELNAENASKYDNTQDKNTFHIGYGTATAAVITVTLNDPRETSSIQAKEGQKAQYYTQMDEQQTKAAIFNAIYDSSTPALSVDDATVEVYVDYKLGQAWVDVTGEIAGYKALDVLGTTPKARIAFAGNDEYKPATSNEVTVTLEDNRKDVTVAKTAVTVSYQSATILEDMISQIGANYTGVSYLFADGLLANDPVTADALREAAAEAKDNTLNVTVKLGQGDAQYKPCEIKVTVSFSDAWYTVTWQNEDGTTLDTDDVLLNSTPAYTGETPTKAATAQYTYTHNGWTPAVAAVTGDASYTATFGATVNKYAVTFVDGNGETIKEPEYNYGTAANAIAVPTTAAKADKVDENGNVMATYTFTGWDKEIAEVTGNATYTATFDEIAKEYTIIFKSHDGEEKVTVVYGSVPEYTTPKDYEEGDKFYTFKEWNPEVVAVTGNATYEAVYTDAKIYKVTFNADGGSLNKDSIQRVIDGEKVSALEATREGYRFDGWLLNGEAYDFATAVTADITLTAKWVKQVTVSFDVEGIDAQTFDINGVATKPEDPTKDQTIFGGWLLNGEAYDFATPVTADITLTANWIDDTNKNGVADAKETITVTVVGKGTVEVTGATELALGTVDTTNYLYDSTKPEVIKITATPVVAEGVSQSCVKSILVGDQAAELTYGENFVATVELTAKGGDAITVTFEDTAFTYDEDGMLFFYSGIETPDPEKLYNAVITAPAYDKDKVTTIEYLARYQGEFTFTIPELFRLEIPIPGLSDIIIGNYDYTVDLNEEWLYVGEEFKTVKSEDVTLMIEEKFAELKAKFEQIDLSAFEGIDWSDWKDLAGKISELTAAYNDIKGQVENLTAELEALIAEVTEQAKWIGYHQFGAMNDATIYDENNNVVETMRVVYKDNGKYLQDDNIKIHLYDDRETVTFANGDVSFEYDEYDNADLLAAVNLVDSKGNVVTVSGDKAPYMKLDLSGKDVGEYTYTVYFDGNNEYKPAADATFTLTVIKAPSSTDIVDVNITFGESYDGAPVITNKHGVQIDADVIEFILGLDVANLDLNENKNGIVGVNTVIQLMMPEELEGILGLLGLEEGATISLSDLIDLLGGADSLLGDLGLSGDATAPVEEALDYLVNIFDSYDLQIMLGGERPTNVGAYLHGAVALDSNYETSYDIGYILIAPKTTEHTLEWNTAALNNAVVTLPAFRNMDLGATAAGAKDMEVSYLFLGINNETGDIYSVDIYGDIKLNVWAYPENIKDNGAYVQMAYGIEWGNEFEYAIPIIRSFVIVPDVTKLDIIVDGQPSADLYKTVFDNAPVDVTVNGQIPEGGQVKLHYYGIEANTETYDSDIAPSHTGAYAITASLVTRDAETGDMTSVGLDVATVVIQPTESSVTMKELQTVVFDGENHNVADTMEITASSTVENLKPDTTVITASIATDGSFSENGWAAVQGTVNVDFPRWMDELIAKYAPSVKDGITLSELEAKLLNKLPTITDKLEELGATNEMVNSTRNLLTNVSSLLDEMPADAVLSFKDDYEVLAVGTYAVAAVVTDSDHIPSVDAGLLVIVPDADQVFLDWDYHDENNIWSRELLQNVSINATAFNDKAFTKPNAQATAKITYQFIGLDQDAGLKIYTDPAQLPNGVYTQIAYIELEVDSQIILSDIIARTIMIVPNMPELQIVDVNGAAQNKFEFTFDNEPVELYVNQNGTRIENEIRYIGLQTNGVEYDRTVAPVHAGVYTAITVVKTQENVGMDVALVTIAPAKSTISVTGGTVPYNGKEQTATVKAESPNSTVTSPDYILISGTVDISAGVQNIGLESLHGDVNIDLPKWLDDVLAKTDFNRVDADVASLANAISAYRDDLMNLIPEQVLEQIAMSNETLADIIKKVNSGIDELLKILEKLPDDVHLTFESNKGYTELGSYFYYGIVTDSDHIPAADTGLLVIEPAAISDDDVEVTFKPVYNGKEQTVTVVVKVGEKLLEEGKDYEVTDNAAINAGKYTLTVTGKGNYTGKVTAEWAIEKADATVTINNASKVYGEEDPEFTATITGLKGDDKLNVVFSREAGQDVGEYVISATIAADDAVAKNYNITIKTGILTITQKDITTGDGYPIYFQPGDANGMIKVGTTVYVDDVAYILDENCVAWAADKNRELAIGYVYKNSGNHTTDHAYSDTTKNMYIWDLQWNEETKSYKADRVEELDNLLSFAGGSIWLGSDGVNGIRTYYSTTADTEAVKGAFRNLGYEVVTHGVVVGWADKLNGSEPVPNGNNSAAGHSAGNGTFYDEIYPAADKYITPDLRARFYVELKNIETSESKIIYSGSVERSIGYIAYQNIGRVDAQYQPYVKAILDKAAAAGFTYGG